MRLTTGPFAAILGQTTTLLNPEAASGPGDFAQVVLTNSSPFIMLVLMGTKYQWIQPSTADLVATPWVGQVGVSFVQAPGGLSTSAGQAAYFTAEWLGPEEPVGHYPSALGSITVAVAVTPLTPSFVVPTVPASGSPPSTELVHVDKLSVSTGGTLIPQSNLNTRIRLMWARAHAAGGALGAQGSIQAVYGGATIHLASVDQPASAPAPPPYSALPSGLALDVNTAVTYTVGAGSCNFTALYTREPPS